MTASTRFSATLHIQNLNAILIPSPPRLESELLFIRQQETLLAQRECWESNISEIQAPGWLLKSPRPILWIGGRKNRRGVTWVSSFTLDLVEALQMESSTQVVYILCNSGNEDGSIGPLQIFKRLIVNLLNAYPETVLVPENLNDLSLQRFRGVGESPEVAYKLLADILMMVDMQCQRNGQELFVLVDRVDMVLRMEHLQERQRFLRALRRLSLTCHTLRFVVTSQYLVEELEIKMEDKDDLMEVWVDTTKPSPMQSRQ